MPCTTILAGKKATYDGSTMIARNEDYSYHVKRMTVILPEDQPIHYITEDQTPERSSSENDELLFLYTFFSDKCSYFFLICTIPRIDLQYDF